MCVLYIERDTIEFDEYAILQCMFRHAQNIALNWFKNNLTNPKFWDKNYPDTFPFDRDDDTKTDIKPVMYPYRTKVDENIKKSKQIIEWSNTELDRVLYSDIESYKKAMIKLNEIESRKTQNDNRKILKERALDKQNKIVNDLKTKIHKKIKTSLYNVKCFEAGYDIDYDESIQLNLKKCLSN